MKYIYKLIPLLIFAGFAVTLSACGGGGPSSGGGGAVSFAGTYTGSFEITLTSNESGVAVSVPGTTTIVINPDGTAVIDPGTPGEFSGTLSGNTLTANLPASELNEPGLSCTGTITQTGTGSGNTFTGTINGSITCNDVPFTVTGTFTVSKTAKVPLKKTTLSTELRDTVRQVVNQ